MTDDLAQWLGARLDAREQTELRRVTYWADLYGKVCPACGRPVVATEINNRSTTVEHERGRDCEITNAQYLTMVGAEPDPDPWVLADVAAKRKLIELHKMNEYYFNATGRKNRDCVTCDGERSEYFGYPCPTLKALAATERGAPGWRTEWDV